jgi:hypothetical protein
MFRNETFDRSLPKILVGGLIVILVLFYVWVFVLPNHPSRPQNVPKSATLVFAGFIHFWQECWFDEKQGVDRCRIYGGGGAVLRDDVFLNMANREPVPPEELDIVQGGAPDGGPDSVVRLKNGKILIPQASFDAIRREMNPEPPSSN